MNIITSKTTFKLLFTPRNQTFQRFINTTLENSVKIRFDRWLNLERYRNGIQPRANNPLATYSELDPKFRPNSSTTSFKVPLFEIPQSSATVYRGSILSQQIAAKYLSTKSSYLAVHPQTCEDLTIPHLSEIVTKEKEVVDVAPTASSRTVFVLDPNLPAHCLKLHFPFQITRSKRSLTEKTIEHSIKVSNCLTNSVVFKKNPRIGFLPESLGIAFGNSDRSWGFLVREMTPFPHVSSTSTLVPLFSLYSPDTRNPEDSPLLLGLIEKSGIEPADFILEKIFFPLLSCWVDTFLETGVLLEAHGQNTCIELDEEHLPKRIIFRDFDTYVNQEIREKQGLPLDGLMLFDNEDTERKPHGCILSIIYDQAMRVPFDRIAELAEKHYGIPQAFFQKKCTAYFHDIFPESHLHFPRDRKVYNYKEGAVLAPGVKTQYMDTGKPPVWR